MFYLDNNQVEIVLVGYGIMESAELVTMKDMGKLGRYLVTTKHIAKLYVSIILRCNIMGYLKITFSLHYERGNFPVSKQSSIGFVTYTIIRAHGVTTKTYFLHFAVRTDDSLVIISFM